MRGEGGIVGEGRLVSLPTCRADNLSIFGMPEVESVVLTIVRPGECSELRFKS